MLSKRNIGFIAGKSYSPSKALIEYYFSGAYFKEEGKVGALDSLMGFVLTDEEQEYP